MILKSPAFDQAAVRLEEEPSGERSASFDEIRRMIRAADGLTLGQVCALCALEPSTIQNWIKRGFVPHPVQKKYFERHLARILLIASVKDAMPLDSVGELMRLINGDADDESDDIISDVLLYQLLCDCIARAERGEEVEAAAKAAVEHLDFDSVSERAQIEKSLELMTFAYLSSSLKKKAEAMLKSLKETV